MQYERPHVHINIMKYFLLVNCYDCHYVHVSSSSFIVPCSKCMYYNLNVIFLQAGWKENLATFMNELKNLQCTGLTTLGAALKHALDVLNINRMQTGIDTYGQGRCPFYLEPSVIVVITDGGKYTTNSAVNQDVSMIIHNFFCYM